MIKIVTKKILLFTLVLTLAVIVSACIPKIFKSSNTNSAAKDVMEKNDEATTDDEVKNNPTQDSADDIGTENEETTSLDDQEGSGTPDVQENKMIFSGNLRDVTNGKVLGTGVTSNGQAVGGISTKGQASGAVEVEYEDGIYTLRASFSNLPAPNGEDFYEGWIVRPSPFEAISTGQVSLEATGYANQFSVQEDFTKHTLYVLTLEPADGDPAPADHILEGSVTLQ